MVSLGSGTRDEPNSQWHRGEREALVHVEQSLGSEARDELLAPPRDIAEQPFDIDLGDGKANLPLGRVDVDVSVETHDHSRLQRDTLCGEAALQGRPGSRPAVGVQDRSLRIARCGARVNQINVDVTFFVDLRDLPANPVRAAAPKAGFQVSSEQLVELAHLQDGLVGVRVENHVARLSEVCNGIVACPPQNVVSDLLRMVSRLGGRADW